MEQGYLYSPYLNLLDMGVIGLTIMSAFLAYYRGFIREFLGIFVWVISAFLAVKLVPNAASMMSEHTTDSKAAIGFSLAGVFIVSFIGLSIVQAFLMKYLKTPNVEAFDKSLGFAFGLLRAYLLICACFLAFKLFSKEEVYPTWLKEASTRRLIEMGANNMSAFLPKQMKEKLAEKPVAEERKPQAIDEILEQIKTNQSIDPDINQTQ